MYYDVGEGGITTANSSKVQITFNREHLLLHSNLLLLLCFLYRVVLYVIIKKNNNNNKYSLIKIKKNVFFLNI